MRRKPVFKLVSRLLHQDLELVGKKVLFHSFLLRVHQEASKGPIVNGCA